MAQKEQKNPLSQAFGMVLRREREKRSWSYEDFERWSKLKTSYIRQVEQGQFNLHVSNCLTLFSVFNKKDGIKDSFTLDGLIHLLGIISVLEASEKEGQSYMQNITDAARNLSKSSEKIKTLFEPFFEHRVFESKNNEESQDLIIENSIDSVVKDFLINYDYFEKKQEKRHQKLLETFFDEVPSVYTGYIMDSRENILKLPFQIAFSGLWQWEERNSNNFETMICICDIPKRVTDKINLSRYSYRYLWEKNFQKIDFMFFDTDLSATEIKNEFKTNLKECLTQAGDKDLIKNFNEGLKKFNVKVVPKEKIFQNKIRQLLSNEKQNATSNALWIFTLRQGYCVSFLAQIDPLRILGTQGVSLNMKETLRRNDILMEMWRDL